MTTWIPFIIAFVLGSYLEKKYKEFYQHRTFWYWDIGVMIFALVCLAYDGGSTIYHDILNVTASMFLGSALGCLTRWYFTPEEPKPEEPKPEPKVEPPKEVPQNVVAEAQKKIDEIINARRKSN